LKLNSAFQIFLQGWKVTDSMRQLEKQTGVKGCALCGGFGHRITNCPKAEERKLKMLRQQNPNDTGGGSAGGGGE